MADEWAGVLAEFEAEMRRENRRVLESLARGLERRLANIEARCDHWQPIIEAYLEGVTNPTEEDASIMIPIADVRDSITEVRQSLKGGDHRGATFALGRLLKDDAELTSLIATFIPSLGQRRGTRALIEKADQRRNVARSYDQRQLQSDPRWGTLSKNARAQLVLAHLKFLGLAQAGKGSEQKHLAFETVRRWLFPSSRK